jgi:hypothetical protein
MALASIVCLACPADAPVMNVANLVSGLAMGAVVIVLLLGLVNMMRGGSPNTSQRLMRWRVGLQFVAICVVMLVLYFRSKG